MITVSEIRIKSERKYETVLRSSLSDENCFPLEIRSNKALSKDFVQMSKEIANVLGGSKDRKGFGYSVLSETRRTRQHGLQDIPIAIVFETLADFLKFVNKEKEFHLMMDNYKFIKGEIPQLAPWLKENPKIIINNANEWPSLVKICQWFLHSFEPNKYYIRELPISIPTKFIESHTGVLKNLLDLLIPGKVNWVENLFEKRFGLRHAEPRIRLRFLDERQFVGKRFGDISIPLNDFANADFACQDVIITENKMNFLTIPPRLNSIAIWGGGFAVRNLKDIQWLKEKTIHYWGDIDVHGFEILSQLRSYYPQAKSIMMDKATFFEFEAYHGTGASTNVNNLSWLTNEEKELYMSLKENNGRLEQEKIPQDYVNNVFLSLP